MTEHDRFTEALQSMEPEVSDASTEHALVDVHDRSHRRSRHQRVIRGAIGAAAVILLIGGAVAVASLGGSDDETVVADQTEVPAPTTTTTTTTVEDETSSPVWSTTTTVPDRLTADELDNVVGLELRTWSFDEDADGFWSADPVLLDAVVEHLRQGGDPVPEPSESDIVTARFERSDGTFLFRRIDVESGWVEPDQQLPEDLVRQMRIGLNDAVASPWEGVDLADPNEYLAMVVADTGFPIRDLDAVVPALDQALEANRWADHERWFIDVVIEGHGPKIEIRRRGMGDDGSRGVDYFFSLVDSPDGLVVGGAMSRHLCLRSTSYEVEGMPGVYGCM